jgi:hypothetical protein
LYVPAQERPCGPDLWETIFTAWDWSVEMNVTDSGSEVEYRFVGGDEVEYSFVFVHSIVGSSEVEYSFVGSSAFVHSIVGGSEVESHFGLSIASLAATRSSRRQQVDRSEVLKRSFWVRNLRFSTLGASIN